MSDDLLHSEIETSNGEEILILAPPRLPLSKERALRLAAWLVVLADDEDGRFEKIRAAVSNT